MIKEWTETLENVQKNQKKLLSRKTKIQVNSQNTPKFSTDEYR